jgi:hypothetical protein
VVEKGVNISLRIDKEIHVKKIITPIAIALSFLIGAAVTYGVLNPKLDKALKDVDILVNETFEVAGEPLYISELNKLDAEAKLIERLLKLETKGAPDSYVKEQYVELIKKRLASIQTFKEMSKSETMSKESEIIQSAEKLLVDIEFGK